MNIAQVYEDELREYLPIRFEGLTFHPLPVKRLALYQGAKAAMELMLSSLPVRFVKMSWIEALDALDKEAADEQMHTGYLGSILALLNETLKLNAFQNHKALMLAKCGRKAQFHHRSAGTGVSDRAGAKPDENGAGDPGRAERI